MNISYLYGKMNLECFFLMDRRIKIEKMKKAFNQEVGKKISRKFMRGLFLYGTKAGFLQLTSLQWIIICILLPAKIKSHEPFY